MSLDLSMAAVTAFATNLLAFAFVLGALIFIHESGHFMVAKLIGIRVEVFSLGFGPRLIGVRRKHTDYRISALPLGGYVKMLGENPDEELRGSPEEFLSRSKLERFLVLVMGASLNIVLAVVIMAGIFMHGVTVAKYVDDPAVVGSVEPGSPAERNGLQIMDRILSVGDREIASWNDLQLAVALNPGRKLPFRIVRDGSERTIEITIGETEKEAMGRVGVGPYLPKLLVGSVKPGSPADKAGLKEGDVMASAAGMDVGSHFSEVTKAILESKGQPVPIVLRRGEEEIRSELVIPDSGGQSDPGFSLEPDTKVKQYPPLQAVVESVKFNGRMAGVLFTTIRKLFNGELSVRTLSGPIGIYKFTSDALRGGALAYLQSMAFISLQLGILNLLPIPVLDGGHIFILLVEGIARRDLSMMVKERVMQVGFVLLLLLMGTVISLDIYKLWQR